MDADVIAERLGPRLLPRTGPREALLGRLTAIQAIRDRQYDAHPGRTPNYCSGCPHNVSTRLLEGQVAWGAPAATPSPRSWSSRSGRSCR